MRVQVAFQGGGARIAALLAAAEALRELEAEGRLQVTRVAGASAGAIAAAFFASGANLQSVRQALRNKEDRGIAALFPKRSNLRQLWIASRDQPLYEISRLQKLLKELLKGHIDEGTTLGQLTPPVLVTVTDAASGKKRVLKDDDPALRAIVDSSALPFVFRHAKGLLGNAHLDGGLCENLPTEELLQEPGLGDVVAVSFETLEQELPSGPVSLAGRMLELSIENSVQRAVRDLGEKSVCRIKTQLKTFDFTEVCSKGLNDDAYGRVKLETRRWFENWLSAQATRRKQVATDLPPHELMKRVGAAYSMLKSEVVVVRSAMVIIAHEFASPEQSSEVFNFRTVRPKADLRCWISSLGSTSAMPETDGEWTVVDADGHARDFVPIPARDPALGSEFRSVALFFNAPLAQGAEHNIIRNSKLLNIFPGIHEGKDEFLSHTNTEHLEVLESYLVLVVPKPWALSGIKFTGDVTGSTLTSQALKNHYGGYVDRANMTAYGWKADNLPRHKTFSVTFTAAKAKS
ncbi:MAG TPA: patatin-like phospholipase family protein [Polyangiaceae bacterium]